MPNHINPPAEPQQSPSNSVNESVRAVDRAIAILQAFRADRPAMSVLELQQATGLSRPTVYRLLATLAAHGFVRAHGAPQRFSLDYAAGQLAGSWLASLDPVGIARPITARLHAQTGETVSLAILQGLQHLYAIELTSPHALSMSRGIGPKEHLTRGASGKVILAHMPEASAAAVLKSAPAGIDMKALARELASIRRHGYGVARGEVIPGVVAVAAPFFDQANTVQGAVVVFGPDVRLDAGRVVAITRMVVESAAEISIALGHTATRNARAAAAI